MPEPARLKRLREELSHNGEEFLKIIGNQKFKAQLKLRGEKTSKVPPGFEKDDAMAEFLKFKELMVHHEISEEAALSNDFVAYCADILQTMAPFNAFLNASFV